MTKSRTAMKRIIGLAVVAAVGLAASGCSTGGTDSGKITITLSGPNQWNNDPQSFGPAWEDLIARFEKAEPGIEVKTTVLPIPEFAQTLSTQLSAGTAPELVFNQAPHKPDQIVQLDKYLDKPNPYIDGNKKWIESFNQNYFGPDAAAARNAANHYEWIPFNLVIVGVYYNKDAFDKAGVKAPLKTVADMMDACGKLKDAGYDPFAMDNGWLGQGWTMNTISSMLLSKYADDFNQFAADGTEGTAAQVTTKSMAKAILTGELNAETTPEVAESMRFLKKIFDGCATPNWSGIGGSASFIGADDFIGGKAAMSFGTNFAATNLDAVDWEYGTMPFPTISSGDSKLSSDQPAQFGAAPQGTSYMIPVTTKGEKLEAAVKFLQFVTSPAGGQAWLDGSGGIPASADGKPAPGLEGLMTGDWFESPTVGAAPTPKAKAGQPGYDGYLLGSKSLEEALAEMQSDWVTAMKETAAEGGWTEDWATK